MTRGRDSSRRSEEIVTKKISNCAFECDYYYYYYYYYYYSNAWNTREYDRVVWRDDDYPARLEGGYFVLWATRGVVVSTSAFLACHLEITIPVGWALYTSD